MKKKFEEFHRENPWVYESMVRLARQAKAAGKTKIGLRLLLEVCRWERILSTTDEDFKINNNYAPYYARLIMSQCPDLKGMFNVRVMAGERDLDIDWDELLSDD